MVFLTVLTEKYANWYLCCTLDILSERHQHKSMHIYINMSEVHFVVLLFIGTGYKSVQYSVSEIKW